MRFGYQLGTYLHKGWGVELRARTGVQPNEFANEQSGFKNMKFLVLGSLTNSVECQKPRIQGLWQWTGLPLPLLRSQRVCSVNHLQRPQSTNQTEL